MLTAFPDLGTLTTAAVVLFTLLCPKRAAALALVAIAWSMMSR